MVDGVTRRRPTESGLEPVNWLNYGKLWYTIQSQCGKVVAGSAPSLEPATSFPARFRSVAR